MVCISSVTEKEALHPVHRRDSVLATGSASLLPDFHDYAQQASLVTRRVVWHLCAGSWRPTHKEIQRFMSSRRTVWLLDLFIMVNCKTLHAWSVCQKHPGLGSVLVVGTPVILNSYLVLTFAGHVQVQREKNHCPREAWDTKLCKKKKTQKTKKQTSQSIHPSIKQKFQSLFKLDS